MVEILGLRSILGDGRRLEVTRLAFTVAIALLTGLGTGKGADSIFAVMLRRFRRTVPARLTSASNRPAAENLSR